MEAVNRFAVVEKIKTIIVESLVVPIDSVNDKTKVVEDLNATSMDVVAIAIAIEFAFDIDVELGSLPQQDINVLWLVDYVISRMKQQCSR